MRNNESHPRSVENSTFNEGAVTAQIRGQRYGPSLEGKTAPAKSGQQTETYSQMIERLNNEYNPTRVHFHEEIGYKRNHVFGKLLPKRYRGRKRANLQRIYHMAHKEQWVLYNARANAKRIEKFALDPAYREEYLLHKRTMNYIYQRRYAYVKYKKGILFYLNLLQSPKNKALIDEIKTFIHSLKVEEEERSERLMRQRHVNLNSVMNGGPEIEETLKTTVWKMSSRIKSQLECSNAQAASEIAKEQIIKLIKQMMDFPVLHYNMPLKKLLSSASKLQILVSRSASYPESHAHSSTPSRVALCSSPSRASGRLSPKCGEGVQIEVRT